MSMSIVHEDTKPVFYSPVQPKIVMTIWDQVSNVMDPEVCVVHQLNIVYMKQNESM